MKEINSLHKVEFLQKGRKINMYLDGVKVKGLRSVRIDASYDDATEVTMTIVATDVEVEVNPE